MERTLLGLRYQRPTEGPARLWILDQSALPAREDWLVADTAEAMIGHIQALRVRGAPMIGLCAALCLACEASRDADPERLRGLALRLRAARPTAVNLAGAVDRLLLLPVPAWVEEAERIADEDAAACEAIAAHGLPLLRPGERILTHCNTGALATGGIGTALGLVRRAAEAGLRPFVWVDETRPLLQGARLTAWELGRLSIPYRLLVDGAAGSLFARDRVDRVLVGADRIARNGDVANKIGTYPLAVLAHHHGVPFHVLAPRSTVDPACPSGAAIPIEERDPAEVRGNQAPAHAPVYNPAFDITPAELVHSYVLDDGLVPAAAVLAGAFAPEPP